MTGWIARKLITGLLRRKTIRKQSLVGRAFALLRRWHGARVAAYRFVYATELQSKDAEVAMRKVISDAALIDDNPLLTWTRSAFARA